MPLILVGFGYLFATFVLPRLLVAMERADGIAIVDPTTGRDVGLPGETNWRRTAIAIASLAGGVVLIRAGVRGARNGSA